MEVCNNFSKKKRKIACWWYVDFAEGPENGKRIVLSFDDKTMFNILEYFRNGIFGELTEKIRSNFYLLSFNEDYWELIDADYVYNVLLSRKLLRS